MTENRFNQTRIRDYLEVISNTNSGYIKSDGDIITKSNLLIGNQTTDTSGNYINTGGNIIFDLNGVNYSISPTELLKLKNNLPILNQNNTFTANNIFDNLQIKNISDNTYYNVDIQIRNNTNNITTNTNNITTNTNNITTNTNNITTNTNNITTNTNSINTINTTLTNVPRLNLANSFTSTGEHLFNGLIRVARIEPRVSTGGEIYTESPIRINNLTGLWYSDTGGYVNLRTSINNINTNITRLNKLLYNSVANSKEITISSGIAFSSGNETTMTTFTGLENSKLYQIGGYISIQINTANLSVLKVYTRIEDGGGGGYTYHKIYSKSGADLGDEIFIQFNDNIRSSNTGSIVVKMCCIFSGGSISTTGGILYPLLLENY